MSTPTKLTRRAAVARVGLTLAWRRPCAERGRRVAAAGSVRGHPGQRAGGAFDTQRGAIAECGA